MDRDDYSASAYSSDVGSDGGGTDAASVVSDDLLRTTTKKARKRGLISGVDYGHVVQLDENYCGLCGSIHDETCHMVQNPDYLAGYRSLLMEVTNEEPVETRVSRSTSVCRFFHSH